MEKEESSVDTEEKRQNKLNEEKMKLLHEQEVLDPLSFSFFKANEKAN